MSTNKLILETDSKGQLIKPLKLPPNAHLEAIILTTSQDKIKSERKPSEKIAGKGKISGDIMMPVVDEKDWNALA